MIVICPACSTRYLVDPRAIGEAGRKVRCARCAQTWLQKPASRIPPIGLAAAVSSAPAGRSDSHRVQLPALPPPPRNRWLMAGWAGLAACVLLVGAGAVAGRDWVVARMPAAERLYGAVGLAAAAPGSGLEFRRIEPSRTTEEGQPALVIEGELANVSGGVRDVPKLRAILRDKADRELQSWSFAPPRGQLAPGESLTFRTSIVRPSDGTAGIVVTFDAGT
jgi:predicted Zn finger-like uncharacterized protein